VTGTTTTPQRRPELEAICDQVAVLHGRDVDAMASVIAGADAVVLTVSPRVNRAFDPVQRIREYADTLTATAHTAAGLHPRVVFTSSVSVYGAGVGASVDETTPTTDDEDASPRNFIRAERVVLTLPRGAVVRIPDVYGHPRDIDYPTRIRFAHSRLGGSVPFAADALFYRLDYRDAAAAIAHVVAHELTGAYNAVPDAVIPPTNAEAFGAICAAEGLPELVFRGEIKTPTVPVSSAKLRAHGFRFAHEAG